jgi:hypothetical protein
LRGQKEFFALFFAKMQDATMCCLTFLMLLMYNNRGVFRSFCRIKEIKKEDGSIRRTWSRGNFSLSLTFFPDKAIMWEMILATVVSCVKWRSIGWAMLHSNWGYIIYYIIRY